MRGRVNVGGGGGIYRSIKKFDDTYTSTINATNGVFFVDAEKNVYRINGAGTNAKIVKNNKDGAEIWSRAFGSSGFPTIYGIKKVIEHGEYLYFIIATNGATQNYVRRINKTDGTLTNVYGSQYACSFDIVGENLIYARYLSSVTTAPANQTITISMYDLDFGIDSNALIWSKNIDGFNSANRDKHLDITMNEDASMICIGHGLDTVTGFITFYNSQTDTVTRIIGLAFAERCFAVYKDGLFYISNDKSSISTTYAFDENMQEILSFNLFGIAKSNDNKRLFAKDNFMVYELENNGQIKNPLTPYFGRNVSPNDYFKPLMVYKRSSYNAYIEGGFYLERV